jgi:hypothetical protein
MPDRFLPLPDLSALQIVDLSHPGEIVVTIEVSEPDRCDDEDCTFPHRIISRSRSRVVERSAENLRAIAEHFMALSTTP